MAFLSSLRKELRENLSRKNLPLYFALIGILLWLIVFDVLSKYYAFNNLGGYDAIDTGRSVVAIPYLLNFCLVGNKGAAWGSLEDQKWLLTTISLIAGTGVLILYLLRFHRFPRVVSVALILIVAGAYGNLVDRIGYWAQLGIYKEGVVDFLQFGFWRSFPVFNLADSYLVIGIFMLVVYYVVEMGIEAYRKKDKPVQNEQKEPDQDLKNLVQKHEDKENDDGKQL